MKEIPPGIFKAYDIRGIYPSEINAETAGQIAAAIVARFKPKTVVVGRDVRKSQPVLHPALVNGLANQGVNVLDIGLCSTPIFYFAMGTLNADLGVMVTASHNPPEYNGFKLCKKGAIPIGGPDGLYDLPKLINNNMLPALDKKKGIVQSQDIFLEYEKIFLSRTKPSNLRVVADTANSMGALETRILAKRCNLSVLFEELDGNCPNHPANPLVPENLRFVQAEVKKQKADFGIAFDGDADRVMFVDEQGIIVPSDIMLALLCRFYPKKTILFDVRSTRAVAEEIRKLGGKAVRCRVGHAFIKKQMRELGAVFAGELSGHYYYQEFFTAESSLWTTLLVLRLLDETQQPLSKIAAPIRRFFQSGEINSDVKEKEGKMKELEAHYKELGAKTDWLDGITIEFPDWWCNIRPSNTEPLLRLNLEADSKELCEEKTKEVLELIRKL